MPTRLIRWRISNWTNPIMLGPRVRSFPWRAAIAEVVLSPLLRAATTWRRWGGLQPRSLRRYSAVETAKGTAAGARGMDQALTGKPGDLPVTAGSIMLVRHGLPAVDRTVKITASEYVDWWAGYDRAG